MDFLDVDKAGSDAGSEVSETETSNTDYDDGDGVNDFDETYNEMSSGDNALEYSGESKDMDSSDCNDNKRNKTTDEMVDGELSDFEDTNSTDEVGESQEKINSNETINQSDMTTDESVDNALSDFDDDSDDSKVYSGQNDEIDNYNDQDTDETNEEIDENDIDHSETNETDNPSESDNAEKQVEHVQCRNENLDGNEHPETGVAFEKRQVEVDGKQYDVVVPQFESKYDAQLPEDKLKSPDREQFKECNSQLKEDIFNNKDLRDQFDDEQIEQIENGDTPDGYTWHHDADVGKMQLVDTEKHQKTGHTGGRTIWGGGNENR